MRHVAALVVGIGLVVGGCRSPKDLGPDTTVPTPAPTTPTTAAPPRPDVTKVPATIDIAYLNAVLAALDEVDGQATRLIVSAKKVQPDAVDRLRAILATKEFQSEVDQRVGDLAAEPELAGIFPNPGNRRTTVERIIAASPACIWLAVHRDYSKVNVDPRPDRVQYIALQPLDPGNNPKGINATPWMITTDKYRLDGSEPANPCPPS